MKTLRYISALAALIVLAACTNDDWDGFASDPDAVRIQATVGQSLTRSNPIDADKAKRESFNNGDQISIRTTTTSTQGPVVYTLTNGVWTPETDKYLIWTTDTEHFEAFYPANSTFDGTETFTVPTDQSTPQLIAQADYMRFSGDKAKADGSLTLTLLRQTARIVINESTITWKNQYLAADGQTPTHEVKEIRLHCGSVKDIIPCTQTQTDGTKIHYALLNPGDAVASEAFIILKVGPKGDESGAVDVLTVRGIPELKAGHSYTCSLILGKDKAFIRGISIGEWGQNNILGEAEASDGYIAYKAFNGGISYDIYTTDGLLEVNRIITAPDATDAMLKGNITLYTNVVLPPPASGESNWTPIGSSDTKPFKGNFYGNGKTITGMVVVNNPDKPYQGFFGCVGGGNVSDLTLIGCTIKGHGYIGGIAGYNSGCNISGCKVIAQTGYPILIESKGYDEMGTGGIGGIVGDNIFTISGCSLICETGATITITDGNDEHGSIGGIVGDSSNQGAKISNCKVENNGGTITLSASSNGVGGVIGQNWTGSISDCSVNGVTISGDIYVGGFAGYNSGTITGANTVKNCTISGRDGYVGLLVGYGDGANITDEGGNAVTKNS